MIPIKEYEALMRMTMCAKNQCSVCKYKSNAKHCEKRIVNNMIILEKAIDDKKDNWISVEEKLPELNQKVLIYAVGKTDGFIGDNITAISERYIFRLFPNNEGVEEWTSPWAYFNTDYKITHWMPLPTSPKAI